MISKGYSGLKYSPIASPFIIKQLGINSMISGAHHNKEGETQNKGLSSSFYNMQLFSPAQEKGTPITNFKGANRELEMCGRRLFQSPSQQFKSSNQNSSVSMITKGGARIYSSRLEDIQEEDQNFIMEHQHNFENNSDTYFYNQTHPHDRNGGNNHHNLDIMIHDDELKGLSAFGGRVSQF